MKNTQMEIDIAKGAHVQLSKLGPPREVIELLIRIAAVGINSPGTWQRLWICQAFVDDWPQVDIEQRIREIYSPQVSPRGKAVAK